MTAGSVIAVECGVPVDPDPFDAMAMIAALLGPLAFTELLVALPESFYASDDPGKGFVWSEILHEVNRGVKDVQKLAEVAGQVQV